MKKRFFITAVLMPALFLVSFGQTILAPDLQCVQNDVVNNNVTLSWTNPPANPCGAFVQYTIYFSQTPGGPYTTRAVTNQAATSEVVPGILGAGPTWYFYMEAQYNCPGATVLQSDTVNNLSPTTPVIVSADVTGSGDAIFTWQPSPSPQTHFYIIYYYLPGSGLAVPLDTVYGRFNTSYTDLFGEFNEPTTESLFFTVAAADSCGKVSSYNTSPHNTIFAQAGQQACQSQVDLAWNRYINWPAGVLRYEVWASRNDSAFTKAGEVDSASLVYNYTLFNDGDSLQIYIRAVSAADSNITARSNVMRLRAAVVQPPRYNYITNATVELDNHIFVTWLIDTLAELTFYKIERSTNNVKYDPIEQIPAPSPLNQFETYEDSTGIMPANNPYYYQQVAFDSCQTQYTTPYVKTINLKGELYDYYVANLIWNSFELEGATVTKYNLYRNINGTYQLLRTFAPSVNTFSDSLQQFLDANGIFCYRIEAVYDLDLPLANYKATLSSFSNEQCIIHRPIIYIPNAFAPNGVNNVFKPTIIYGEPKGYVMSIFNRWGAKIFESNDPAVGWDGTDHGKEAQLGGYAYLIQFGANDGVQVERKGMVLLVK
jgi:gliding motility-associated-like protein